MGKINCNCFFSLSLILTLSLSLVSFLFIYNLSRNTNLRSLFFIQNNSYKRFFLKKLFLHLDLFVSRNIDSNIIMISNTVYNFLNTILILILVFRCYLIHSSNFISFSVKIHFKCLHYCNKVMLENV